MRKSDHPERNPGSDLRLRQVCGNPVCPGIQADVSGSGRGVQTLQQKRTDRKDGALMRGTKRGFRRTIASLLVFSLCIAAVPALPARADNKINELQNQIKEEQKKQNDTKPNQALFW